MILDSIEKYEEVFSGIKSEIEMINGGKKKFYEEDYARTDVNTDDDIPLDKPLKFLTLSNYRVCFSRRWKIISSLFRWMFVWIIKNVGIW